MDWVPSSVSDLYSFDPDQAFEAGSRALMTKNWKKFTAEKNLIYF
jgi:hypothetical protein